MKTGKNSRKIAVLGLGYVGLPIAKAFSKVSHVIGFDSSQKRVDELISGMDRTHEVSSSELKDLNIQFTTNPDDLRSSDFFIITVPTPVDSANQPDFESLVTVSKTVGRVLKKNDIVCYESTVYPGATEEICVPILEASSGLKYKTDFQVGYSPERINPGDREHSFENIKKVVSGSSDEALQIIADAYGSVITGGVHKAQSIAIAEAAKVIENTQRDLNIALMNELSVLFDKIGLDTLSVLEAAGTKWNFLPFRPGLVGGHCIGVDPYYLTHKAEKSGYIPQVILAGRRINDSMGVFVAHKIIKLMSKAKRPLNGATLTVLGATFKENCPDIRNSRIFDTIKELREYGILVQLHDPLASTEDTEKHYNVPLKAWNQLEPADVVLLAVPHAEYLQSGVDRLTMLLKNPMNGIFVDLKGVLPIADLQSKVGQTWRL